MSSSDVPFQGPGALLFRGRSIEVFVDDGVDGPRTIRTVIAGIVRRVGEAHMREDDLAADLHATMRARGLRLMLRWTPDFLYARITRPEVWRT